MRTWAVTAAQYTSAVQSQCETPPYTRTGAKAHSEALSMYREPPLCRIAHFAQTADGMAAESTLLVAFRLQTVSSHSIVAASCRTEERSRSHRAIYMGTPATTSGDLIRPWVRTGTCLSIRNWPVATGISTWNRILPALTLETTPASCP